MSERHQLDERLESLDEIREVMSSLKTLAYLETRKLARYAEAQQRAVASIRAAAADFAAHFPVEAWQPRCAVHVFIVLGSERGFCGTYNDTLGASARDALASSSERRLIIAIGGKLLDKLASSIALIGVAGAGVAEEVQPVLLRVAEAIAGIQQREGSIAISVIYLDPDSRVAQVRPLFPLTATSNPGSKRSNRPDLNVEPETMFTALLQEQLYTTLVAAYYDALSLENRLRMEHLEGAVEHLDRQRGDIRLKRNYLRQEEIIEEIEVILLSATPESSP